MWELDFEATDMLLHIAAMRNLIQEHPSSGIYKVIRSGYGTEAFDIFWLFSALPLVTEFIKGANHSVSKF
jgi:hypothetical protein